MKGHSQEEGLWTKHMTYREQPRVKYSNKLILVLQAKDSTTNTPKELFYSTFPQVNKMRPNSIRMATVHAREIDDNLDGLADRVTLSVTVPLNAWEEIYTIQALIFVDCGLRNHVKIDMESLAYVHYNSGIPISTLTTRGDLTLRQTQLFSIEKSISQLYSGETLLDLQSASFHAQDSNIERILSNYGDRVISTHYLERTLVWKRADNRGPALFATEQSVDITITMDIPHQNVAYVPTLFETLREAWIRYVSVFCVVLYVIRRIHGFVYPHQLVTTRTNVDRIPSFNFMKNQ